jgi:transcriptional regulator with XRE-family HTH domain
MPQEDIAELAGVDVSLVEQYEKSELSPDPHKYEQLVAHEQITRALLRVFVQRYPEKVEAAVRPVLELAKTYPDGSMMREFLNSTENFLKP